MIEDFFHLPPVSTTLVVHLGAPVGLEGKNPGVENLVILFL
jgi:hypothetical protein